MSSNAPRQLRASEPAGPLRAPAADVDTGLAQSAGNALPAWSDSPRQLKQGAQLTQLQAAASSATPAQGGLPQGLRQGIESMSGLDMSGVRVHRNSSKPAALQAHAYAQGQDIHLGPGQEKHLPHEAWHVVQQAQGRVQPTVQLKAGVAVNDDRGLEAEADVMGARALAQGGRQGPVAGVQGPASGGVTSRQAIQCTLGPHQPQTRDALSEANGSTKDAATLKRHAEVLLGQIPDEVRLRLTPMAQSMTPPPSESKPKSKAKSQGKAQGKGDGIKLLDQICRDLSVSRGGWADIQGYTRELSLGALYANQGRLRQARDGKDSSAKADAFWLNSGGPAAAQMKTILDVSKISAPENLPKAIQQINGQHGETPPAEAARVADIGVTDTLESSRLDLIDQQVAEVVKGETEARADAIRIWVTVKQVERGGRVGMLRQFDSDGRLTHSQEYPLPDFDTSGHSPVADFVLRGAPHELPIPYPASYPAAKKTGAVAPLGSLAQDAKLLFGLAESLQREIPLAYSSTSSVKPERKDADSEEEEGFNLFS